MGGRKAKRARRSRIGGHVSDYQSGGYQAGDDAKERVRQASDIVEVVSRYLPITSKGRHFVARCPWHDDTRPSFQVSQQRQTWRCWVCGIGGDVFSFVMKREGIEFREALELLAERANIELPKLARGEQGAQAGEPTKREIFEAMSWAEALFFDYLRNSTKEAIEPRAARDYLRRRGILPETARKFRIGYAADSWQWVVNEAKKSNKPQKTLVDGGVIGLSEKGRPYDRFKGRVIFPIHDAQGRTIGFGGRILPEAPGAQGAPGAANTASQSTAAKYVNSPETRIFSKSEHVYALDIAKDEIQRTGEVIVVEGYTDVIGLHQAGITNSVAVLGTALGERHVRLLKRYANTIYLVLDGDEAGQRRTNEVLEIFVSQQADLRVVQLPTGKDPCDIASGKGGDGKPGADLFRELLAKAVDAIEHKIRTATAHTSGIKDVHAANEALEDILNALSKSPADADPQIRLREHQVLARLAQKFQIERDDLKARLASLRQAMRRGQKNQHRDQQGEQASGNHGQSQEPARYTRDQIDPWDLSLLELLILDPGVIDHVMDEIGPDELTSEPAKAIYAVYRSRAQDGASCELGAILASRELSQEGDHNLNPESLKALLVEIDEIMEAISEAASNQTGSQGGESHRRGLDLGPDGMIAPETQEITPDHSKRLAGVLRAFRDRFEEKQADQMRAEIEASPKGGDAGDTRDTRDTQQDEQEAEFLRLVFQNRAERDGVGFQGPGVLNPAPQETGEAFF